MNDDLRSNAILPNTEPYGSSGYTHINGGGNEAVSDATAVFAVTGNDAIVDWVVLEVRDATDPVQILASQSVLLQRDGDLVGMDGTSLPQFTLDQLVAGSYYLAVRHRNHLGVMTANPLTFSPNTTLAATDFTAGGTYGSNTQELLADGSYGLWGGDANFNGQVQNTDIENYWKPTVGESGYQAADFNLNGQVQNTNLELIWKNTVGIGAQLPGN
ncbi:MAG: hypothetical protein D6772_07580 [Bacteroidetes bacterium]|nr:MAG: hypothetical protein D6772_07580 [Bacteroidota bacterium]